MPYVAISVEIKLSLALFWFSSPPPTHLTENVAVIQPEMNINLAKLNCGQPKPSSFLRFPVRFPLNGWGLKTQQNHFRPIFSPIQAILNIFDFFMVGKQMF